MVFFAGGSLGVLIAPKSIQLSEIIHPPSSVQSCYEKVFALAGIKQPDLKTQSEARSLCLQSISDQGYLNDFQLRRMAFFNQDYQGKIVLWIVVIITLSGVILAALQLVASYNLSTFGRPQPNQENSTSIDQGKQDIPAIRDRTGDFVESSRLEFSKDRVIIQSSLTGLLILLVSFAFFFVFVTKVYTQSEVDPDARVKASFGSDAPTLLPGGSGHVSEGAKIDNAPVPPP